jgi:hypothetical protein
VWRGSYSRFDNDGKQDIFLTNGAKLPELKKVDPSFFNCLLRNQRHGTFENVTEKSGHGGGERCAAWRADGRGFE